MWLRRSIGGVANPFGSDGGRRRGPRRKARFAIPDSPAVAVVTALITLGLAAVLFITALPGEEGVLYFEGREVSPSAICEITVADGKTEPRACAEIGEFETRPTGWRMPPVVIAAVLAAMALVVLAGVPKQVKDHRKEEAAKLARLTDEDFKI
jgi:hypothetical protein